MTYSLPQAHRRTLRDSIYIPNLDTTVKLVIGVPEDLDVLLHFICDRFSREEPIDVALKLSAADLRNRYYKTVFQCLSRPLTIIAVDCFEICGVVSGRAVKPGPKRTLPLLDDYAEKIEDATGSLADRQNKVFVEELESWTPNHLPDDCEEFFRIDFFSVMPEYQNAGLGKRLWFESLSLAQREHFCFVESGCSAVISTSIAGKFGMKSIFTFPYASYRSHGEAIFGTVLHDGSKAANLMFGEMETIGKKLDEYEKENPLKLHLAYTVPKCDRVILDPKFFVSKLQRTIRIEIATADDSEVISRFLRNEAVRLAPLSQTLQCGKTDVELVAKSRGNAEVLNENLTLMAIDEEDKICGLLVNTIMDIQPGPKVSEDVKRDFTAEIDAADKPSFKLKVLSSVSHWLNTFTAQNLPSNCTKVFIIDFLGVHPLYRGCKIGEKLWLESLRLAKERGYEYTQCICTAIASNKIALASGMKVVHSYNYSDLHYRDRQLFSDGRMYDGGEVANLIIGNLNEMNLQRK
ncbi:Dopamine N-acetyltransferase [Aphelenchoides besseyi]|nr:Dopamine N-acetyltransferase [Aphelenchoides besseyi]